MAIVLNGDGTSQEPLVLVRVALVLTLLSTRLTTRLRLTTPLAQNKNAMSVGDITVATGVTVTVPTGSFWVVV
jgi:hypothetical protein